MATNATTPAFGGVNAAQAANETPESNQDAQQGQSLKALRIDAATHPDAAIINAWERKITAVRAYDALTDTEADNGEYSPEAAALWDIIDAADADILNMDESFDWGARLVLAAIRSLQAMGEMEHG